MIKFIFTLDYEIYGDGSGDLKNLVLEPAQRLREIFLERDARFVAFVEAAELEKIEEAGSDGAIGAVKRQVRRFKQEGFEVGLHLHPQWANARYEHGAWRLDFTEYNLCTLPERRIENIAGASIEYLRRITGSDNFSPVSFRAGNWLFQPSGTAARVLLRQGVKIDSSVFKGGVQHNHGLDYRRSLHNGYFWTFNSDVNTAVPGGAWLEMPIHTEMVPFWRMATSKRLGFKNGGGSARGYAYKLNRLRDLVRFRYPLKLDFCRMTLHELITMTAAAILEDRAEPDSLKPLVAIGHTKDLTDPQTVSDFLAFLHSENIQVTTFEAIYPEIKSAPAPQLNEAAHVV